jgi:hypothetical protein
LTAQPIIEHEHCEIAYVAAIREHIARESLESTMSEQEQNGDMSQVEMVRALVAAETHRAPINDPNPRQVVIPPQLSQEIWNNAPFTPSPSLHPGVVEAIEGYAENVGYLAPALNAFSTAHVTLKQISDARAPLTRDTSKTPEQKLLLMAAHAEKQHDRVLRTFDKALKDLGSAADTLDKSLSQPLESRTHAALSQELRGVLRGMPDKERATFVADAVKRGDQFVIETVLGSPAVLSGLHEAQKANWLRQYHEERNPEAVKRLAAYRKALELLETRAHLVTLQIEKAMGGKFADVHRLRGQVEASDKALAAIGG